MQEEIVQFVVAKVNGQNRKVGALVGRIDKQDQSIRVGWSRTNFSKGDTFDRDKAYDLAHDRTYAKEFVPAPHSFKKNLGFFKIRCKKYFKNAYASSFYPITFQLN